jgi:hypothetical protein
MNRKLLALLGSVLLSGLLAACGSDSGGATPAPTSGGGTPPPAPPPAPTGTLEVRVVDPDGVPVPYAQVNVNAPADSGTWMTSYSDGSGIAVFSAVPTGPVAASANGWPSYYSSDPVQLEIETGIRAHVALTIAPVYAGTAVVLATRYISGTPDGSEIEVEADIAVVDPSGQPITGIDASQVTLPPWDCGDWDPLCIVYDDGQDAGHWIPVTGTPNAFEWMLGSATSTYAAGLLVDQGTYVGAEHWDPGRKEAIVEFLDSFDPANSVALAEFRSLLGPSPVVQYNGGFTSDASELRPTAMSLEWRVGGGSPVAQALSEMIGMIDWLAPPQTPDLVLVRPAWRELTAQEVQSTVAASGAFGIPVNAIAPGDLGTTAAVSRTGGALLIARFPAQMRTAFRALDAVLSGSMPFYRMRFRLQLTATTAAGQPRTLRSSVGIALPERDELWVPISVRLGPAAPAQ